MGVAAEEERVAWANSLRLYDEPHGDEHFVIDHCGVPPVWYRLDGSEFSNRSELPTRPKVEVLWAIRHRGWTSDTLYRSLPQRST